MKLSPYQEDILSYVDGEDGNLIVQACAGSGKTTTLREICLKLPRGLSVVALCFNKVNAQQFGKKLPHHVDSSTMHSAGMKILRHHHGKLNVNTYKMSNAIEKLLGKRRTWGPADKELADFLRKVVPLCRSLMLDIDNINDVEFILDNYACDKTFEHTTINEVCVTGSRLLRALRDNKRTIDFDDMLDQVVYYGLTPPRTYDVILGDEVQDWNKLQAAFVGLMAGKRSAVKAGDGDFLADLGLPLEPEEIDRPTEARVILVGDRNQSIYAFRGADTASMDNLAETFHCHELPLSVCYRCPTSVIARAQTVVGEQEIQSCDGAPDGTVTFKVERDYEETIRDLPSGAMVLCRTNAPLLPAALQLIREGRKACVRGRDIAANLKSILRRFENSESVSELLDKVETWAQRKATKLMRNKAQGAAQAILDQEACIRAVAQECDYVDEIGKRIDSIFSDEIEEVTFSSAHRAKGLEADYVVILGPELMPHPMALKYGNAEAIRQEDNLLYVAITRSMDTLIYQPIPQKSEASFSVLFPEFEHESSE